MPTAASDEPQSVVLHPSELVSDAFGRVRVSIPLGQFDVTHQYNASPLFYGTIITGSAAATHLPNESSVQLSTTASASDSVKFQTKRYLRYYPGRSLLVMMTYVFGAKVTNVRRRAGYFDDNDGIFLEQTGTELAITRRTSTSGSSSDADRNTQANWNIDTFDGTGPSGLTLDDTKTNILVMDLEWLGVGRVRVGFNINGVFYPAHEFRNANALTAAYMKTANLPIRYEQANTGAPSGTNTMKAICSVAINEGSQERVGITHSANNGVSAKAVTTRRPILTIRPSATFNSLTNRGQLAPLQYCVSADANALVEFVYNGTLTGASFASVGTNSNADVDTSATAISGGEVLDSIYIASNTPKVGGVQEGTSPITKILLTLDPAGSAQDTLTVVVTSVTGTANTLASLTWNEVY